MKFLLILIMICNFSNIFSQENANFDKRNILFFVFDSTSTPNEMISKQLGRVTDSSMISDVKLIKEDINGNVDTIICYYKNNIIAFRQIDSSKNSIAKISLSLILKFSNYKGSNDEMVTFPFKYIFEQTNINSDISISLVRHRNNLFRLSISKLDYPFIVSSQYLLSEIIGFSNINKRKLKL